MPWRAGQGTVRPTHGKKKALAGGSHASARKGKGARKGPAEELDWGKKRRKGVGRCGNGPSKREKGGNGKERGFGPENEPAEEKEKEKERGKELG